MAPEDAHEGAESHHSLELQQTRAELARLRELERRSQEQHHEMAAQQSYLRSLLENLQDVILMLDPRGVLVGVAGNVMGMLGTTEQVILVEPPDVRLQARVHPEDWGAFQAQLARLDHAYGTRHHRLRLLDVAGEVRWGDALLVPLRDDDGSYAGAQVIVADVSSQVQVEAMVGSLNAAAQAVQHASLSTDQVLAAVTDELAARGFYSAIGLVGSGTDELRVVRVAGDAAVLASAARLLGPTEREYPVAMPGAPDVLRAVLADLTPRYGLIDEPRLAQLLPATARPMANALVRLLPSLHTIWAPLVADNVLLGVLAVSGRDVSRSLIPPVAAFANHAAIALQNAALVSQLSASEQQYRGVFEAMQDGLLVVTPEGLVVSGNPPIFDLMGCAAEEAPGRTLLELFPQVDPPTVLRCLADMRADGRCALSWEFTQPGAPQRLFRVHGTIMTYRGKPHWLLVLRDVTEQLRAQEALVSSERLRALGQMAGGIAHDFNNILVSVRGFADAALLDLTNGQPASRQDLQRIVAGANDATEAVRRLQSLYRMADDTSDFVSLDPDEQVRAAVDLTRPHWRDGAQARGVAITIGTELGSPPPVVGNASELRRVLTNLLVNAIEAMPSGGEIRLTTWQRGPYSCIQVQDTGIGMSKQDRERVFEPFFSTKSSSGLGLAVSKSIIQRHGGAIEVSSVLGAGTTFVISLPITTVATVAVAEPQVAEAATARSLSVLVVDDESSVRTLLSRFLQRLGHKVQVAEGAQEGLAALATQRFDLLITDLGMPGLSGDELARRAHARDAGMRIVLSTGWGATISPNQLEAMHAQCLLPKPFTYQELESVLEDIFGERFAH
jgi:PAS domain S-box-containing protein